MMINAIPESTKFSNHFSEKHEKLCSAFYVIPQLDIVIAFAKTTKSAPQSSERSHLLPSRRKSIPSFFSCNQGRCGGDSLF
jgi:hypothetical protein